MMPSVTSCPTCLQQVSLPASDDHSVWVRCPLCNAQYPLKSAIDYVPPTLQIVPAPAADGMASHVEFGSAMAPRQSASDVMFDDASIHAQQPQAVEGSSHVDLDGKHRVGSRSADDQEVGFGFDLEHQPTDVPFVGEDQPLHDDDDVPMEEAADDEFHFASDAEASDHSTDGDQPAQRRGGAGDGHGMGAIASMVKASPVKKKRKVPLLVRVIGLAIFFGFGLLGLVLVYTAFLFFGGESFDQFGIRQYWPKWLVAKSAPVRAKAETNKPPEKSEKDAPPPANQEPANNGPPVGPLPNPNNSEPTADAPKTAPANPKENDDKQTAVQPPRQSKSEPAKAEGDSNPIENPLKADLPDLAKTDPTKVDPFKVESPKPPKLDLPPAVLPDATAKTPPDKKPADNAEATVPPAPADKKPADKTAEKASLDKPADSKPADDKPVEKTPPEKPAEALPAEPVGPKSDVAYTLDDLDAAIQAANGSSDAFDAALKSGAEAGDLKMARIAHYKAMSHLATVLTFVKGQGADFNEQLARSKGQVVSNICPRTATSAPAEREPIGKLAGRWIASPSRKESGLFVVGTLKKTAHQGRLFESEVEVPGNAATITIATSERPAAEEGSPVVVLGSLVNEPAKNLSGFEGSADTIVWGVVVLAPPKGDPATAAPAVEPSKKPPADDTKPPAEPAK
jgi:hypothetical protein